VFVVIYLGAAALTIQSNTSKENTIPQIESADLTPAEGRLMMIELFLPMMIVLVLTVCFIVVRIQRAKKYLKLDDPVDDIEE
jgi:flagellar biogenesis protein FliO